MRATARFVLTLAAFGSSGAFGASSLAKCEAPSLGQEDSAGGKVELLQSSQDVVSVAELGLLFRAPLEDSEALDLLRQCVRVLRTEALRQEPAVAANGKAIARLAATKGKDSPRGWSLAIEGLGAMAMAESDEKALWSIYKEAVANSDPVMLMASATVLGGFVTDRALVDGVRKDIDAILDGSLASPKGAMHPWVRNELYDLKHWFAVGVGVHAAADNLSEVGDKLAYLLRWGLNDYEDIMSVYWNPEEAARRRHFLGLAHGQPVEVSAFLCSSRYEELINKRYTEPFRDEELLEFAGRERRMLVKNIYCNDRLTMQAALDASVKR